MRYLKGQLHAHTKESDGSETPETVLRAYHRRGYSFVALTDHNRRTIAEHHGITYVSGKELTAKSVHLNLIGRDRGFDQCMNHLNVENAPAEIAIYTALLECPLAIVNHPTYSGIPWQTIAESEARLFELHNAHTGETNEEAWDSINAVRVAEDRPLLYGVAVDDSHGPDGIDKAWIAVAHGWGARPTQDDLLAAIRLGLFYASTGIEFHSVTIDNQWLYVGSQDAARFCVYDADGLRETFDGYEGLNYRLSKARGFVRVRAEKDGRYAWTQPFAVPR